MSWSLPPQVLPFAGVLAFLALELRLREPRSPLRTVFDAVAMPLLLIALVWAA